MIRFRAMVTAAAWMVLAHAPLGAQFSSDLPGIPRAGVPRLGSSQGRFVLEPSWAKGEEAKAFGGRMGFGRSWRIASNFELGFDFTLLDAQLVRETTPAANEYSEPSSDNRVLASVAYGLRVGAKVRPISFVSPEGYGVEVALGAAVQPAAKAGYWYESFRDSTWSGGLVRSEEGKPKVHPPGRVNAFSQLMLAVSYRDPRITADAALVRESPTVTGQALTHAYVGTALRAGATYRVSQGTALGVVWWGDAAPPWRDRVALPVVTEEQANWGVVIQTGLGPGRGTDLMLSSPSGSLSESVSLYIRVH